MISSHFRAALATCALVAAASLHGQSFTFNFDSLADGAAANLAVPAGTSFEVGTFTPDLDIDGDAIPGSERWRIDLFAAPVVVRDPQFYDRGAAPSGPNALDAVFDPTLLVFSAPQSLLNFSVTLDNDSFGDSAAVIEFYSVGANSNTLLASIPIDQTTPGLIASLSVPVAGVDMVVLPAGAMYDNISYTAVPEPSTYAFAGGIMLCGAALLRRCFGRK